MTRLIRVWFGFVGSAFLFAAYGMHVTASGYGNPAGSGLLVGGVAFMGLVLWGLCLFFKQFVAWLEAGDQ